MRSVRDLYDCENERLIRDVSAGEKKLSPDIIRKEMDTAFYDLSRAKNDLAEGDFKWATVKAYYAILHAANALVRSKGRIIKSHQCTYLYLSKLARAGEIEQRDAASFMIVLDARMDADYGMEYDEVTARESLEVAEGFCHRMKELLDKN